MGRWVKIRPSLGWLHDLLRTSEDVNPDFAFASTVHLMRGLALVAEPALRDPQRYVMETVLPQATPLQQAWSKENPDEERLGRIFEHLYRASDLATGLDAQAQHVSVEKYPSLILGAIGAWYYAMYSLAQALLTSMTGDAPTSHQGTANAMTEPAIRRFLPDPFFVLATRGTDMKSQLAPPNYPRDATILNRRGPSDIDEGRAVIGAYIAGTWTWQVDDISRRLRKRHNVKRLTRALVPIRDSQIKDVGFFHGLYRYRTKAHYRDGIYTSYGRAFAGGDRFLPDCVASYKHLALVVETLVCRRVHVTWYRRYVEDVTEGRRDASSPFPGRWQGPIIIAAMEGSP